MNKKTTNDIDVSEVARLTKSLHMCSVCGCLWRLWKAEVGFNWSLADHNQKPGKCCGAKLVPPVDW